MNDGIIIYGAPGTGKDATTVELVQRCPECEHFKRIKIGTGRKSEYRTLTPDQLDSLRAEPGAIIWENPQYGGVYIVDRAELERLESSGFVPVLHLGQPEAIETVLETSSETHWLVVELTCPRDIAIQRIMQRETGDTEQRIAVLDATSALKNPDLLLDTSQLSPADCAAEIEHARTRRN